MTNDSLSRDFHFSISILVRFADCDMLGHVNHAKMFTYMEEARGHYLTDILKMEFTPSKTSPDVSAILAEASCAYKSPAKFEETLTIQTRILELGRSSFVMDYRIIEQKTSRLVATGKTTGVFFDYKNQKSVSIPVEIREKIEKFEKKKF